MVQASDQTKIKHFRTDKKLFALTVPKVATRELTWCFDDPGDHEMITDRVVPPAVPDLWHVWVPNWPSTALTCGIAGRWRSGMIAGRGDRTVVSDLPAGHVLAGTAGPQLRSKDVEILVLWHEVAVVTPPMGCQNSATGVELVF